MKKLKIALFLCLCAFAPTSFADGVASFIRPAETDDIQQILDHIFHLAGVVDFGYDSSNPVQHMSLYFLSALLAVGIFWFSWSSLSLCVGTAATGKAFGNTSALGSTWIPIRFGIGMSMLTPIFGGYCGAQILVFKLIQLGSSIATGMALAGVTLVDPVQVSVADSLQPTLSQSVVKSLLADQVCMESTNQLLDSPEIQQLLNGTDVYGEKVQQIVVRDEPNRTITVMFTQNNELQDYSVATPVCGKVTWSFKKPIEDPLVGQIQSSDGYLGGLFGNTDLVGFAFNTFDSQVEPMLAKLHQLAVPIAATAVYFGSGLKAPLLAPSQTADLNSKLQLVADEFVAKENSIFLAKFPLDDKKSKKVLYDAINKEGWVVLGSLYRGLAQGMSKVGHVFDAQVQIIPPGTGSSYLDSGLENTAATVLSKNLKPASPESDLLNSIVSDSGIFKKLNLMLIGRSGSFFFSGSETSNLDGLSVKTSNPIFQMKGIGDSILDLAGGCFLAYGGYKFIQMIPAVKEFTAGAKVVNKLGNLFDSSSGPISGLFTSVAIAAVFLGFFLSVYLPLIPFITFFSAIINYIYIAAVAVISAPLGAFAHLETQGEGLGPRTEHGYMFLLNVLFTPACVVFAFFIAVMALEPMAGLLIHLFGAAVVDANSGNTFTGLFSLLGNLFILGGMLIYLTHTLFSLAVHLAEKAMQWIGSNVSYDAGRDHEQHIKTGFVNISGRAEGTFKEGLSKARPGM